MNITILNSNKKPNWSLYVAILVIVVLTILWAHSCSDRKTWEQELADKEDQRQKDLDSTNKVKDAQIDELMRSVFYWKDSIDIVQSDAEVFRYERNEAWKSLATEKMRGDQLVKKIKEVNGVDSADCLELANLYTDASGKVLFYKSKSDSLVKKLDTAGVYKDKVIKGLEYALDTSRNHTAIVNYAYNSLKASFDRVKPHSSLWIGADVTVLPSVILAGPHVMYQTKRNTAYTLGIGLDSRDVNYYIRAGVSWKVSFRRKP